MNSFSILALSAIFALAEACAGHANVGEFWMDGVSRDSGWYDINKTWNGYDSNGKISNHDDNYCWAAAGSNILSWWQDQLPSSLQNLPDIPTGENIYNTIRNKAEFMATGFPTGAWKWFLNGESSSYLQKAGGAYYQPYIPVSYLEEGYSNSLYVNNLWGNESGFGAQPISTFKDRLQSAMQEEHCGIALSVNLPSFSSGHSITLWGVEYDDLTNQITKLFITDSDDAKKGDVNDPTVHKLVTLGCKYYTDTNFIYLYDIDEEGHTIPGTYTDGNATIFNVYGLKAYTVPEPASSLLLLTATAFMLVRRRKTA